MSEGQSILYIPNEDRISIKGRTFSFFSQNNFTLLKPNGQQRLLQGPRRVVRLCVFALLLPAAFITVPLYVRLVLYPPAHYPMMPTDQRLLGRHASSIWCQAQWTHMNGSYNAYVSSETPPATLSRTTHHMLHSTTLHDDVKEYWGFHLLKGSTVTVSTCASTDGAQLMILRGVKNLHRCAWIGEEDSAEDDGEARGQGASQSKSEGKLSSDLIQSREGGKQLDLSDMFKDPSAPEAGLQSDGPMISTSHVAGTSEERQQGLEFLLRKAIRMSKNNKEILRLLHTLQRTDDRSLPRHLQERMGIVPENSEDAPMPPTPYDPPDKEAPRQHEPPLARKKRGVKEDPQPGEYNGALEIFDEIENPVAKESPEKAKEQKGSPVESLIGGQVFFPEGLRFERGKFNQTNKNDASNEEKVSSYSSSEEALASCKGVIMTLPLATYRGCSFRWIDRNRVVYDIPVTGTYYFVFSSDNEIASNNLFFNLTLERVTYDTQSATRLCANTSECSLPLSFWSSEQTLVEVPEEETWGNSYVLDITCQPRVPVFFTFILMAPLLILLCAFQ